MKRDTCSLRRIVLSIPAWICIATVSAADRPHMQVTRHADSLTITWPGGGVLESAPTVTGPWTELPEATSPHTVTLPGRMKFYRINAGRFVLKVAREGEGQGGVTSTPAGIDCGTDCVQTFPANSSVQLVAEPDAGSVFAGWSGDCTGTDPCVLTMDGPKTVHATFSPAPAGGLVNGDFEQGPGVGWTEQPGGLIVTADSLGVMAFQGQYVAWLGYAPDDRDSATIGQQVTVPNTWPVYLNFALWLYSEDLCDTCCWDRFGFYVNGEAVVENARLCQGNTGGDGWRPLSIDISAYAGQTVWIVFEIAAGPADPLASIALLDAMHFSDAPW